MSNRLHMSKLLKIVLVIVIIIAAPIIWMLTSLYMSNVKDKKVVDITYSTITLPSSLQLTKKDIHGVELGTEGDYTYTSNLPAKEIEIEIVKSLQSQSFNVNKISDEYFRAKNSTKHLNLAVTISAKSPTEVYINVIRD